MKLPVCFFYVVVSLSACTPTRPPTFYSPKLHGAMDLDENPNARHCSELTRDFRDAYGLEDGVKNILSVAVPADEESMTLWSHDGAVKSSLLIGDSNRLRAFWHHDGWTLAIILDHGCQNGSCPTEITMIKYNGAKTPQERPSKLCFERWVGTFERQQRPHR